MINNFSLLDNEVCMKHFQNITKSMICDEENYLLSCSYEKKWRIINGSIKDENLHIFHKSVLKFHSITVLHNIGHCLILINIMNIK